jgi:SAM-dependent methyltransferase
MTKRSTLASHTKIWEWVGQIANRSDMHVFEIGSRSLAPTPSWKKFIPNANYIGIDVIDGSNVDVVGDAHRLSDCFQGQKFDLIMSFAVLEHVALPWIVASELATLLNNGGYTVHEMHFTYSEHGLPWHFFQFNSIALEVLFCPELGFEVIDSGLDNPIDGVFSPEAAGYLAGKPVDHLFCHSSIIAQMVEHSRATDFKWSDVADRIRTTSMYPS